MRIQNVACVLAICAITRSLDAAPFLEGRVTDEYGRPIEGASVTIADCIGSFCSDTTVLTDASGHYIFEAKTFENWPSLTVFLPGRYEISREQSGPELHEPDTETARRADFVLGTPAAARVYLESETPEGWSQSLLIQHGEPVERRRHNHYSRSGFDNQSYFDMLPQNENLHLVVVREKIIIETDDPEADEEQWRENRRNKLEIVSPPILLVDPQLYVIRAKVVVDGDTPRIAIESVINAVGADRTGELVVADPIFGPPVDAEAQRQALALLERVAAAAAPWNAGPSSSIGYYEYDAIDSGPETIHVMVDPDSPVEPSWDDTVAGLPPAGPLWSNMGRLRGVAYMSSLYWLFSQPENIVFLGVDITEERAVLHYRLKESRGFGGGLGIGSNWDGFFTSGFSTGRLIIDPRAATVLEHRHYQRPLGDEIVETFSDYVAVGTGYAPLSMRIQTDVMDFQLSFRIHEDTLWLLEEA